MVVGTTLMKSDGDPYYSPSFPRGGLAATFALNVTHRTGDPTFKVTVEHKAEADATFGSAGAFADIVGKGPFTKDLTGLQEVLRFKYEFDVADDPSDSVHFLMQAPTWRPY